MLSLTLKMAKYISMIKKSLTNASLYDIIKTERKKERIKIMTTTKIIPAKILAKELGIETTAEKNEKRKIKIAEIKDSLIETINENLKKRKWALVQIERDLLNRTNLTREELIAIGKELAKEYKKAGYQILAEKEYSENNYYKFYSFRIEF